MKISKYEKLYKNAMRTKSVRKRRRNLSEKIEKCLFFLRRNWGGKKELGKGSPSRTKHRRKIVVQKCGKNFTCKFILKIIELKICKLRIFHVSSERVIILIAFIYYYIC